MSGASSNAAARRRRAAPPVNVQRLRQQQQQQQQQQRLPQQTSNNSTFNVNNISLTGLPHDENGRMMHPINILKNLNERINVLESNPGSGTFSLENNEEFSKLTQDVTNKLNQEIKNMNDTTMASLQNCINNYSSIQENIETKIDSFQKQINSMQDKIEEIKELCSKIQTFSMETNMSFLIFKNQYDKINNKTIETNTENASFINFLQNLNTNNIEDTESLQLEINTDSNSVENIIVENLESLENFEYENEEQEIQDEQEENTNELNVEDVELNVEDCSEYVENIHITSTDTTNIFSEFADENIIEEEGSNLKKTNLREAFKYWYEDKYGIKEIPQGKELYDWFTIKYGKPLPGRGWLNIELVSTINMN